MIRRGSIPAMLKKLGKQALKEVVLSSENTCYSIKLTCFRYGKRERFKGIGK
jgi:hypothetical protein